MSCRWRARTDPLLKPPAPSGVLVALIDKTVVVTAEYVIKGTHVYVQGIAVHPNHRRSGVCRALLAEAEKIAKAERLGTLALCAIEETRNVKIFEKMGFRITSLSIAPNHASPSGGPVNPSGDGAKSCITIGSRRPAKAAQDADFLHNGWAAFAGA
jgi:ribosomal protein S18 acetylase RimI-like enzyme